MLFINGLLIVITYLFLSLLQKFTLLIAYFISIKFDPDQLYLGPIEFMLIDEKDFKISNQFIKLGV